MSNIILKKIKKPTMHNFFFYTENCISFTEIDPQVSTLLKNKRKNLIEKGV